MVIVISTINVRKPAATVSFVSFELYFTCMKNRTTSVILMHAIASATTALKLPRSTYDTAVVVAVRISSARSDHQVNLRADDVLFVMRRFVAMLRHLQMMVMFLFQLHCSSPYPVTCNLATVPCFH